ncbi:HAD family hydrolase [Paenibacillus sp. FSL K6-3182]|uniref:HAD family hydrolase n=2 Tax=unclassified Paenibacillus TaxID=185978 RepID=UPI0030CEEEEA
MIKAVYFDLDDTLYDQLQPFRLAAQGTDLEKHVMGSFPIEDVYKRIRRHSDRLWEQHARGELSLEELRIQRTVSAFSDIGLAVSSEAAVQLQRNYEQEQLQIKLRANTAELFEQLEARGMQIGLITNGPVEHQMSKIRSLSLLSWINEEHIFISDGMGIAKPNREVFQHVQQQSGYRPEQLIYVGDAWHNDIKPSFLAGWTPIWLNPRKQLPLAEDGHVKYLECQSIKQVMPLIERIHEGKLAVCSKNMYN